MLGEARDWPSVDPSALRGWADVVTWEDLDYFIAARASMDHTQLMLRADDHERFVATMVPSYYSICEVRREGVHVIGIRHVPPLRVAGR